MTTFAEIVDGHVVRQIVADAAPDGGSWLPVVVEMPDVDWAIHRRGGYVDTIESDRVVRLVSADPIEVTAEMIRAECQRRIIAEVGARDLEQCIIKQINAQARLSALYDRRVRGDMTEAEADELAGLQATADAIMRLRDRSNELEAMTLVPSDYRQDWRWT